MPAYALELEVVSMNAKIERPDLYIDKFADAGADIATVHAESKCGIRKALEHTKGIGLKAGIAVNPETAPERFAEYLQDADELLIMCVHPGFSGQEFIPEMIEKLRYASQEAREKGLDLSIAVDGGVNISNVRKIAEAGADTIVASSAIFGSGSVRDAIAQLRMRGDADSR